MSAIALDQYRQLEQWQQWQSEWVEQFNMTQYETLLRQNWLENENPHEIIRQLWKKIENNNREISSETERTVNNALIATWATIGWVQAFKYWSEYLNQNPNLLNNAWEVLERNYEKLAEWWSQLLADWGATISSAQTSIESLASDPNLMSSISTWAETAIKSWTDFVSSNLEELTSVTTPFLPSVFTSAGTWSLIPWVLPTMACTLWWALLLRYLYKKIKK